MLLLGIEDDQTLSEKIFLLAYHYMSAMNRTTIARDFNGAMQALWPDGVKSNNAFLLVTHAVP